MSESSIHHHHNRTSWGCLQTPEVGHNSLKGLYGVLMQVVALYGVLMQHWWL